jgi:hypothetical protein
MIYDFKGPILKVGKSPSGIVYTEEILIDLVNKFNHRYNGVGSLGQLKSGFYVNETLNLDNATHIVHKLKYDNNTKEVIVYIELLNNTKALHLNQIFKKYAKRVKVYPIIDGTTDDDNIAINAELIRVDFFYNKFTF